MTRYQTLDRTKIRLRPIAERGHDLLVGDIHSLQSPENEFPHPHFPTVIQAIKNARHNDRPVVLMMGGHPIKLGLSRYLIDLMENDWMTHIATNGAGIIHDFELATVGGTSENVAQWIACGQFGLWQESSRLNDVITAAARRNEGFGEAVGRTLVETSADHAEISLCAAGWRLGIPVTSHVTIGGDIIHPHANADGSAIGQTSFTDFLIFANSIANLEGGVFLNVGSAVTGPEVFLKALSAARNLQGGEPKNFTTVVFDLVSLPDEYHVGPPGKEHPLYYYRPWKTLLCRTVSEGGQSIYVQGDHRVTIPALWSQLHDEQCLT